VARVQIPTAASEIEHRPIPGAEMGTCVGAWVWWVRGGRELWCAGCVHLTDRAEEILRKDTHK
jgi:hypothetical protein